MATSYVSGHSPGASSGAPIADDSVAPGGVTGGLHMPPPMQNIAPMPAPTNTAGNGKTGTTFNPMTGMHVDETATKGNVIIKRVKRIS